MGAPRCTMASNVFWLVSVPGGNSSMGKMGAYNNCKAVASQYGSPCHKFDFETLKVGTLDALMLLSDELDKYDKHADMTLRRIMRAWTNEVVDDNETNLASALKVDIGGVEVSAEEALCSFRW